MMLRFSGKRKAKQQKRSPLRYSALSVLLLVMLVASACASWGTKAPPASTPTPTAKQLCAHAYRQANPIAAENACPGSDGWHLDHPVGPENAIEAFVAPASVNAGESLQLYVTTTAARYFFQIYRMGYYQGHGGRLIYTSPQLPGVNQPAPIIDPTTRMVSCDNWSLSATIHTDKSWVSGVYIIKLLSSLGFMRYTLFIVRNDASTAPIAMQIPFITYQAYNRWGDHNLYRGLDSNGQYTYDDRSYAVSFDRPYNGDPNLYDANAGLGDFPLYDFELLNWLEKSAYNLTYFADIDVDQNASLASSRKLIIISGHSEYWSTQLRNNVTQARDKGTSLAFFGANDVYWHVRLASSPLGADRIVICYKSAALDPLAQTDPLATTVRWEDPPLNDPEASLIGQEYGGGVAVTAALTLNTGSQPFLSGTQLQVGSSFPGLVGGEYDRVAHVGSTAGLSVIAASVLQCVPTYQCPTNNMDVTSATIYQAKSGAEVFDAGTFQWSWGLSDLRIAPTTSSAGQDVLPITGSATQQFASPDSLATQTSAPDYSDPRFQQLTANIIAYLLIASK